MKRGPAKRYVLSTGDPAGVRAERDGSRPVAIGDPVAVRVEKEGVHAIAIGGPAGVRARVAASCARGGERR